MFKKLISGCLQRMPFEQQRQLFKWLSRIPFVNRHRLLAHEHWVRSEYDAFGRAQRKQIFLSIARFAHINRPIEGYYFEFGSHEANTMRLAWDTFRYLFNWTFVSFDSFEGLPEMEHLDRSDIFYAGNLATTEDQFIDIVTRHGMPADRLRTVKGFYEDSLTPKLSGTNWRRLRQRSYMWIAIFICRQHQYYASFGPFCKRGRSLCSMIGTVTTATHKWVSGEHGQSFWPQIPTFPLSILSLLQRRRRLFA